MPAIWTTKGEQCSFNPHPTRRLGAIPDSEYPAGPFQTVSILTQPEGWVPFDTMPLYQLSSIVSILTQPEGWVPYEWLPIHHLLTRVSILTQPEGWVPSVDTLISELDHATFQSSPNPKVGCHSNCKAQSRHIKCFNPHPTRRLGAIRHSRTR